MSPALDRWEGYDRWPDPPLTYHDASAQRLGTQYLMHFLRNRDPHEELRTAQKCCWFLCRYGMQNYREVLTWPIREVVYSMELLGEWIEKEAPKTTAGPS